MYRLWFKLTSGPGNKHIMGFDSVFVLVLREVSFVFALPFQKIYQHSLQLGFLVETDHCLEKKGNQIYLNKPGEILP